MRPVSSRRLIPIGRGGARRATSRTDGCSDAAPTSTKASIELISIERWNSQVCSMPNCEMVAQPMSLTRRQNSAPSIRRNAALRLPPPSSKRTIIPSTTRSPTGYAARARRARSVVLAVGGLRPDEEDPGQKAEPGRDDGGVDEGGPVAARGPPAHDDDEATHEARVEAEPQRIGQRGGAGDMEQLRHQAGDEDPADVGEDAQAEQRPGPAPLGLEAADADGHEGGGGSTPRPPARWSPASYRSGCRTGTRPPPRAGQSGSPSTAACPSGKHIAGAGEKSEGGFSERKLGLFLSGARRRRPPRLARKNAGQSPVGDGSVCPSTSRTRRASAEPVNGFCRNFASSISRRRPALSSA